MLVATPTTRSKADVLAGFLRWLLIVIPLASGTGCCVGPGYLQPPVPLSETWIDAGHERLQGEPIEPGQWWTALNDPLLTLLIVQTHNENLTLREAGMRIIEARAAASFARGNVWPQSQQVFGDYQRTQLSKNRANIFDFFDRHYDNWSLGLSAAWELDFWGRFQRAIDAADADLDASVENYNDALVLLLAEVGTTYVELRTLERRLNLVRENVEIQGKTLNLATKKHQEGQVSGLDVSQAETNLRQTEALVPTIQIAHRQANNRLCVLLGQAPRDLESILGFIGEVPKPAPAVAVGVPADLLRRRPDVRRAERELAAQSERIGIAAAEFYPHVSITGSIGLEAEDFGKLFKGSSLAAMAGPSFRWNILNYHRLRNNVQIQTARFERLSYAYQNAVLRANAEAENAIVRFLQTDDRLALLRQSVAAAKKSVEIAYEQYAGELTDFQRVYLLETQLVEKLDELATVEGEYAASFIAIYKALGGGWQIEFSPPHGPIEPEVIPTPVPTKLTAK